MQGSAGRCAFVDPRLDLVQLLRAQAAGRHLRESLALEAQDELTIQVPRDDERRTSARSRRGEPRRIAGRVTLVDAEPTGVTGAAAVAAHALLIPDLLHGTERIGAPREIGAARLLLR